MLPVYERLFDVKYNFVIFPFILIGYALFCSTTQLMTKSTESLMTAYYLNAKQHSIVGAHKAGPRQIQAIVKFLPKAYYDQLTASCVMIFYRGTKQSETILFCCISFLHIHIRI